MRRNAGLSVSGTGSPDPDHDAGPIRSPARRWWYVAGGILLVLVWMVLILGASTFLGLLSEPFSWFWAALALSPGLLGGAFLIRGRSRAWLGGAVAVSVLLGLAGWFVAPPGFARIQARADDVVWPSSWQQVRRVEGGNTWCFKGCPEIEYVFDVPATYGDDDDRELTAALAAAGWSPVDPEYGRPTFRRGRWRVSVVDTPLFADLGQDVSVTFSG